MVACDCTKALVSRADRRTGLSPFEDNSTPEALHSSSRRQRRRIVAARCFFDPEGVKPPQCLTPSESRRCLPLESGGFAPGC